MASNLGNNNLETPNPSIQRIEDIITRLPAKVEDLTTQIADLKPTPSHNKEWETIFEEDPHPRRPNQRNRHQGNDREHWNQGLKNDVGDYDGKGSPETCLKWLDRLEMYMTWAYIPHHHQIEYSLLRLKGPALVWWKQLNRQQPWAQLSELNRWVGFKIEIKSHYVPSDFS